MLSSKKIKSHIGNSAKYLLSSKKCHEDHLIHSGRLGYTWTLLHWLERHNVDGEWRFYAEDFSQHLFDQIGKDKYNHTIILPGSHTRRNYSSTAIDCGIFVDSYYDFESLVGEKEDYKDKIEKIALGYNLRKCQMGEGQITYNQVLWAGTGLSRWAKNNPSHSEYKNAKLILLELVRHWTEITATSNGYSPYKSSNSDPYLEGVTTYYHSRCIAFCIYILENLKEDLEPFMPSLIKASEFLLKMYKPSGVKELYLESKRYYFWGEYETGSHPYDIYVFYKMYENTNRKIWKSFAAVSIKRLLSSIRLDGSVESTNNSEAFRDWQCSIMRTGHLAWLTRVSDDFLDDILNYNYPKDLILPTSFFNYHKGDPFTIIGSEKYWLHFVVKKTPLSGYSGGRATGLIISPDKSINSCANLLFLQYEVSGNPIKFLRKSNLIIYKTFRHVLLHGGDWFFYKRNFSQGWRILKNQFFDYIIVGMFKRRTEFNCKLQKVVYETNKIHHLLDVADLNGNQNMRFGSRTISWSESKIEVRDVLIYKGRYKVNVPKNWIAQEESDGWIYRLNFKK